MNLPAALLHGTNSVGECDKHQFVQNLGKELREIREKVGPLSKNKEKIYKNHSKEGDLVLVHQQPMERTHKLPPQCKGFYEVTKVPNPFQAQYQDGGKQKITHVQNCKKFHGR